MLSGLKIGILGTGALGAYYGGRLAQHGGDLHFVARSDYQRLREQGLRVQSWQGDFAIPPSELKVYSKPEAAPAVDVLLVTLKATAIDDYARLARPMVKDDTLIVCLQNGLGNEERFAQHFGGHRVAGGIAYTCINRGDDGQVLHTSHGHVRIGEFGRPAGERLRALAAQMTASKIDVEVVDDLHHYRWDKLVWNIAFNGLGAALDLHCGALLASEAGVAMLRAVMTDTLAASAACGVTFRPDMIDYQIERTYDTGAYHTSMQLDRRAKRPMEVEAIIGEPLRRASERGAGELPRLAWLYDALRAIDAANTQAASGST
jgi:2-dehydropantoate 2-reductase